MFQVEDRGESRSQVLQGLLSLLRVTVIAVAVGPLAKVVDAHVSLRVGQTLLISGEEAKPLEGKDGIERLPLAVHITGFAIARTYSSKREERINSRCEEKGWGCGSELFRKAAGVDSACDCHSTLEVTQCEQGVHVGDV